MLGGIWGCLGCILCQKWLRLSWKVEECKPLPLFPIRSFIWFPLSYCRNSLDCRTVGRLPMWFPVFWHPSPALWYDPRPLPPELPRAGAG